MPVRTDDDIQARLADSDRDEFVVPEHVGGIDQSGALRSALRCAGQEHERGFGGTLYEDRLTTAR